MEKKLNKNYKKYQFISGNIYTSDSKNSFVECIVTERSQIGNEHNYNDCNIFTNILFN